MRGRGLAAAAGATAILACLFVRARPVGAPRPESESDVPAEAEDAPPLLERMPTLAARPRVPRDVAAETEAIVGEGEAAAPPGGPIRAVDVERARVGLLEPAAPDLRAVAAPDALWRDPRPDVDPSWPLFTEDEAGRRHAMRRGFRALARLPRLSTEGAVWAADRIRRDLTEGLFLPETADPAARAGLEARIAELNAVVYGHRRALEGVTEIVVAARGDYPYRMVEHRPFGSNTVLFWNRHGLLDPRRMPAGVPLVVPLEPLTLFADREARALHLLLGDAWIREFRIGVGAPGTPTPAGRFAVRRWPIDRRAHGGKAGEDLGPLGSAWIGTYAVEFFGGAPRARGRGPSIHGTDRPESIGQAESDGSIRLENRDASELLRWLDTRHGGPIRLYLR